MDKFTHFKTDITHIDLPEQFTFPFYYDPHELSKTAASELQQYLVLQTDFEHNFGLPNYTKGLIIGKMFGVLVVQRRDGQLGYLSAFSGKLAESNHHDQFVPPVHDILAIDGFYRAGEQEINVINAEIEKLEADPNLEHLRIKLEEAKDKSAKEKNDYKDKLRIARTKRKIEKAQCKATGNAEEYDQLYRKHEEKSLFQRFLLKELIEYYDGKTKIVEQEYEVYLSKLTSLKEKRKKKSGILQRRLFNEYTFLNARKEVKSLNTIFLEELGFYSPAGAGECAAPKLLQYAYKHELKPIALAEFWWGDGPKSQIRKHQHFYPACRSKCEPILGHMLSGLSVEENPLLDEIAELDMLDIVYEDEYLVAVNKPPDVLSVPGKNISESIQTRLKERYPLATGPLLVHRLDMSTSGILLAAKLKDVHKHLHQQFEARTVQKRYVAILEKEIDTNEGIIDLPLRVDLDNRPHQMVCYEHGKPSKTAYKVIERKEGITRIHFFPITGRTHQLRVHSAHSLGLNAPIIGDDLYGDKGKRLMLHAEHLEFIHPIYNKKISIVVQAPF